MRFDFTQSKLIRIFLFIVILAGVAIAGNVYVKEGDVTLDEITANENITASQFLGRMFGQWNDTTITGVTYQAETDGLVTLKAVATGGGQYMYLTGYTDGSNPPTTVRIYVKAAAAAGQTNQHGGSFPVRKGDYWKIGMARSGGSYDIYWLPLGGVQE